MWPTRTEVILTADDTTNEDDFIDAVAMSSSQSKVVESQDYIVKGERYKVTGRAPKFKLIIEKDSNNKKVFVHASLFKKESKITRVKKYILEKIYIIFGRG